MHIRRYAPDMHQLSLTALLCIFFPLSAQTLKPSDPGANPLGVGTPASQSDFPAPGEASTIGKMPKIDGALAELRKKFFYLGELTWRGGIVLAKETSDWGETRKN